jgi:hypothetical protein
MNAAERSANKSLTAIERRAYQFGRTLGNGIKIGAGVAVAALGALTVAIGNSINNADAIRDLSIRIGVGTERLSEYAYAAKQTGTDIEGLGRGLKILSKNLAEAADPGSGKGKLFEALGVEVKDAAGNLKQLDVILPEIANKFKLLEDGTTKAALAQELFGKSGLELTEFLNQGAQGLDEMGAKARSLGIIISEETAAAADEFNDRLADLRAQGAGFSNQITAELLPALNQTVEEFSGLIRQGELASNVVAVLSAAFSFGVGILKEYNNAVARTSIALEFMVEVGEAARKAATGGILGQLSAAKDLKNAVDQGQSALDALVSAQQRADAIAANNANLPSNFSSGSRRRGGPTAADIEATKAATKASQERISTEQRLAKLLGGDGGGGSKKKAGGKSDAEKEADSLKEAYERQNEALEKQIALFGQTSEASQVQYQIQTEDLSKLDAASKAFIQTKQAEALVNAQRLDQMKLEDELGDAANKRLMEESEAVATGVKETDKLIADMEFELSLIGKTNAEREKAIALRSLDANATDAQRESVAGLVDELHRAEELQGFIDDFKTGLADAFVDFATGAKSAKEAFGDFADSLFKRALQFVADKAIQAMFDAFSGTGTGAGATGGTGGGWQQFLGTILGAFGGGRAAGGQVNPGMFYRINESGMEMATVDGKDYLMTGSKSGTVTSAGNMGGVSVVNNFKFASPTSQRTQEQVAQRMGQKVEEIQRRNS